MTDANDKELLTKWQNSLNKFGRSNEKLGLHKIEFYWRDSAKFKGTFMAMVLRTATAMLRGKKLFQNLLTLYNIIRPKKLNNRTNRNNNLCRFTVRF